MADRSGQQLGNYRLNKLLGKGGFGAVYHATNLRLNREQAIKVLLEDHLSDPKELDRFLREAQTLAKLDHINIVHVDELGMDGTVVYLVMPFLSGGTLQEMLKRRASPLSLEETERILEQVCAALDFAHGQGVVHLDLKPLNLLRHQDGRWLLSDFGLAHLMQTGALIGGTSLSFGTPHYMAPEHVLGNPERRSDLYALGCMLYQLLTGHLPFEAAVAQAIMFKHVSDPPPKLSGYRADLPVVLEGVMAKALAKKPEERYQTAGEMLAAYMATIGKRTTQPAAHERATIYQRPSTPVPQPAAQPTPLPPTIVAAIPPIVNQPSPRVGTLLLTLTGHKNAVNAVAWSPDGRHLASASFDGAVRLWDAASGKSLSTLTDNADFPLAVAWSPDGLLASAGIDHTVRLWDVFSGKPIAILKGHTDVVWAVAWSPDSLLASASQDRTVRLWDTGRGKSLMTLKGHTNTVYSVAWSPDGILLASAGEDGTVRLWDVPRGTSLAPLRRGPTISPEMVPVASVAWSPDNQHLASANKDKTVDLWNTGSGLLLSTLTGHADVVKAVAWSPDGRHLASASLDQTVRLWDAASGHLLSILKGHADGVYAVAWSPDGTRIASAGDDKTVRIWRVG